MTNAEELVYRLRLPLALLLVGLILAAGGVFLALNKNNQPEFEIVSGTEVKGENAGVNIVEVSGEVNSPGVYELPAGARVEDALMVAGGLSSDANTDWVEKYLNRAANVIDGQKIYIPSQTETTSDNNPAGEQSGSLAPSGGSSEFVNINTASKSELEELYGIGPVYAQKIIDNRPYSSVEELLVKKVITQKIYDDNKHLLTIY